MQITPLNMSTLCDRWERRSPCSRLPAPPAGGGRRVGGRVGAGIRQIPLPPTLSPNTRALVCPCRLVGGLVSYHCSGAEVAVPPRVVAASPHAAGATAASPRAHQTPHYHTPVPHPSTAP